MSVLYGTMKSKCFLHSFVVKIIELLSDSRTCEIWCGETDGAINVFSLKDSVVSGHYPLSHFTTTIPVKGHNVSHLYSSENFVYSYVAPGCILYQWNSRTKQIENRLDCSKLVPCSESLKSISIEEHLSPGKCQVSSLAVYENVLYIGTTWGCVIIAEKQTLRPITVFRPFEDEIKCIIPLPPSNLDQGPMVVTIGRGYRSLIDRYTDVISSHTGSTPMNEKRPKKEAMKDRSGFMHALLWRADNWSPV